MSLGIVRTIARYFNMNRGISVISIGAGAVLKYFNITWGISVISKEYRGIFEIFPLKIKLDISAE